MSSGRQPEWPSASVLARSSSMARTTSVGSGSPTPAAWLSSSRSCSSRARSGGTNVEASEPNPVVTP